MCVKVKKVQINFAAWFYTLLVLWLFSRIIHHNSQLVEKFTIGQIDKVQKAAKHATCWKCVATFFSALVELNCVKTKKA